jgi:hypothetical protein
MESIGTKAFTIREMKGILADYPVCIKCIRANVTKYDLLYNRASPFRFASYILASLLGFEKIGWFMTIELEKVGELEVAVENTG